MFQENGEKPEEQVPEVKTEPMDSDDKVPEKDDAEVKEEPCKYNQVSRCIPHISGRQKEPNIKTLPIYAS